MKVLPSIASYLAIGAVSLAASSTAFADGHESSILYEGDYLFPGQRVVSDGCYNHLDMQTDGNLVLYAGPGTSSVRWAAGLPQQCISQWPFGHDVCYGFGAGWSTLQTDGNFVQYDATATAFWASNTAGGALSNTAQVWVQDDGNLVEYRGDAGALWSDWATSSNNGEHLGQSPCEMQTSITHIDENLNLGGADYKSEATNDYRECAAWCAISEWATGATKCNAFTWVPPGVQATTGMCWLKWGIPGASYASGMYSGTIRH